MLGTLKTGEDFARIGGEAKPLYRLQAFSLEPQTLNPKP